MTLKDEIKADLYRYDGKIDFKTFRYHYLYSPGFRFTFYYRMACTSKKWSAKGILGNISLKRLTYKYGYQIPKVSQIGKGFLIRHFGNVIINGKVVIGDNCNIYPGVTIGATFRGKNEGAPVIGNSVWIGTNAVLVGGIVIGNNVLIAPNSYVNCSVPSNSIVFGNPAIIKEKLNATDSYIENLV